MGLDDVCIFSLFACWYIFRGLCCQSFSIWFLLQLNMFQMQSCRKADRVESQVFDFQHIWEIITGMKMSTSCRMGGSLVEILLSLSLSLYGVQGAFLPMKISPAYYWLLSLIKSMEWKLIRYVKELWTNSRTEEKTEEILSSTNNK